MAETCEPREWAPTRVRKTWVEAVTCGAQDAQDLQAGYLLAVPTSLAHPIDFAQSFAAFALPTGDSLSSATATPSPARLRPRWLVYPLALLRRFVCARLRVRVRVRVRQISDPAAAEVTHHGLPTTLAIHRTGSGRLPCDAYPAAIDVIETAKRLIRGRRDKQQRGAGCVSANETHIHTR